MLQVYCRALVFDQEESVSSSSKEGGTDASLPKRSKSTIHQIGFTDQAQMFAQQISWEVISITTSRASPGMHK